MFITGDCRRRDTICDGVRSPSCLEDDEWTTGTGFKCIRNGRICRLPQQLLYDDFHDCEKGEDVCDVVGRAGGDVHHLQLEQRKEICPQLHHRLYESTVTEWEPWISS